MPSVDLLPLIAPHGLRFVLVMARVMGLVWPLTSWGALAVGFRGRVWIGLLMTLVLAPMVPDPAPVPALQGPAIAWAALGELARGLALGLACALVVGAARQAGELIGQSLGLTPLLDLGLSDAGGGGGSDGPLTATGTLALGLAILAFLSIDGPMRLLVAMAETYQAQPIGAGLSLGPDGSAMAQLASLADGIRRGLAMAVRLAVPIVVPMVLVQSAALLLSQSAPGSPWSSIVWPLRVVIGLAMVAALAGTMLGVFEHTWLAVLGTP